MKLREFAKHVSTEALNETIKELRSDIDYYGKVTKFLYFLSSIIGLTLIILAYNNNSISVILGVIFGALTTFTLLSDMSVNTFISREDAFTKEVSGRTE